MLTKGEVGQGGEINQESEINIYILLYIKQINNKDLLYSTGNYNYIQCLTIIYNREESEKEYIHTYTYSQIYICITKSLCCIPKHCKSTIPQLLIILIMFKTSPLLVSLCPFKSTKQSNKNNPIVIIIAPTSQATKWANRDEVTCQELHS